MPEIFWINQINKSYFSKIFVFDLIFLRFFNKYSKKYIFFFFFVFVIIKNVKTQRVKGQYILVSIKSFKILNGTAVFYLKKERRFRHWKSTLLATPVSLNLSPYPNQTLEAHFSKTARQKLKVKLYSYRTRLTL